MRKIRILMVLGNSGRGGSQAYVMNVLRNIDKEQFQIDVVYNDDEKGGYGDEMRHLGSKTYLLPFYKGYNYFTYVRAWQKLLSEHHYDIVHAHATGAASIYLRIAKRKGCITIAHSHSAAYRGSKFQQYVKKVMAKSIKKYSDYWFACSDKAAERLFDEQYKTYKKYYEIPNAINTENFVFSDIKRKEIRKKIGVQDNVFLCGHVGTFSTPKNHFFLIDVFERIHSRNNNSNLVLCGEGPLMQEVKKYVSKKELEHDIIMTGNVQNIGDYMMAMDVMVFPSLFEGFPVTLIEAQATGLRVVYSDTITKEVELTDRVTSISLSESVDSWAEYSMMDDGAERKAYNRIIEQSVYNMHYSINHLSELYIKMTNNY